MEQSMRTGLWKQSMREKHYGRFGIVGLSLATCLLVGPRAQTAEDFQPAESVVIDAQAAQWNGNRLDVSDGRLTLKFNKVQIGKNVRVTFKGFRHVTLNADTVEI